MLDVVVFKREVEIFLCRMNINAIDQHSVGNRIIRLRRLLLNRWFNGEEDENVDELDCIVIFLPFNIKSFTRHEKSMDRINLNLVP